VRVAVIDIGTNSTRLLLADVDPGTGAVQELQRESKVTRLGAGVDASGRLDAEAQQRVIDAVDGYRPAIEQADRAVALMTSAVRDSANGEQFAHLIADRFAIGARVLTGEQEAQLTFAGAMSVRGASPARTVVIDIGGGSTEFVIGAEGRIRFHVSTAAGVVRMSERHISSDPPSPQELTELALDTRGVFHHFVPDIERGGIEAGIAVAGTATSAAAMEMRLEPYDASRVDGHIIELATVELLLARLAEMNEERRRDVPGLHPDRAPTIVAGMILLQEAMALFGLEEVEVSEHDILTGGALELADEG